MFVLESLSVDRDLEIETEAGTMIQIQSKQQFTKAAARLERERMNVRRQEPHLYEVTNKTKGHTYHVRFTQRDGQTLGSCDCPAGLRNQKPLVCKHLVAAIIYVRAIRDARDMAEAYANGAAYDGND
jgi:hypothetical protein